MTEKYSFEAPRRIKSDQFYNPPAVPDPNTKHKTTWDCSQGFEVEQPPFRIKASSRYAAHPQRTREAKPQGASSLTRKEHPAAYFKRQ